MASVFLIGFAAIVILTVFLLPIVINILDDCDEETLKMVRSIGKKAIVIALVCATLVTFVPSEETITKMLIAQNVTYERVEVVGDTVQSVYGDIMELFEEKGNG